MIGKEVVKPTQLREMLVMLNEAMDGPAGVALKFNVKERVSLVIVDDNEEAVVDLPGDGRPFPVRAYMNALMVSKVMESNG